MIRILNAALVVAALVAASIVYSLERESRLAEGRLAEINRAIAEEREQIRRLRAEWSYLNTPARLEKLAVKHLQHVPSPISQVIKLNEVAAKVPGLKLEEETGGDDAIGTMLDGNVAAVEGEVPPQPTQPDLIGNILKGME
ncbi:MAG: hypothetical protein AAGF81_17170 [Pseudomonadota bacterium]